MIIGPYDDNFATLAEVFSDTNPPDFIKEAEALSEKELTSLPDHCFALIGRQDGEYVRKYACADKPHTAINTIYFDKARSSLPQDTVQKVATNLRIACERYGLEPPEFIKESERLGESKPLIKSDSSLFLVHSPTDDEKKYPIERDAKKPKNEDRPESVENVVKKGAWDPYVNLDSPVRPNFSNDHTTSIRGQTVPLDDFNQVKKAASRFENEWRVMHPHERRIAAVDIDNRAEFLGIKTGGALNKYAGSSYRSDDEIADAMIDRIDHWPEEYAAAAAGVVQNLMEKRAFVEPDVFASAIEELDIATGLDIYWGTHISDPWETAITKTSEDKKKWSVEGKVVTEDDIRRLAADQKSEVEKAFGRELANGLSHDPVGIFDSLPLDTQSVLAAMVD